MSISSDSTRKAGPFTGTGLIVSYPFTFKVFQAADVLVTRTDLSGVETILALGTDYSISLNSNQDASPGGTVVPVAAAPIGYLTTLSSQVPALQPVVLTNSGGFYPTVLNDAMDRLTIIVQQLKEQISRAITVPISSSTTPSSYIAQIISSAASAVTNAAAAAASAVAAAASAAAALVSKNNAATSETNAGNSATAAASSASSALTSKNNAATSETNAGNSATAAAGSATSAGTSATNAGNSATAAAGSATAAAGSATSAAGQLTAFKNIYYGPYASNPTTRPDTTAMQAGDEYYNTSSKTLQIYNGTSWGAAGVVFNPIPQTFSGTGSQTNFTLSQAPGIAAALLVSIGGVSQTPGTDFTISGTTLTFTTAPPLGTNNINTVNFGVAGTIGVPANASITNAMLQASIVQSSNLAILPTLPVTGGNLTLPQAAGIVMVSSNMPTFQAYVNSSQSVTGGVWTKLALNAKEWDTASAFDAVTNYRFTPLVGGYYQLSAACPSVATAAGANNIAIYKNGSLYKTSALSTNGIPTISCMVSLNGSTDYIECYVNLGSSQSISASGNNFMSACLVRNT